MIKPETWDAARVEVEATLENFADYHAKTGGLGKTHTFEEIIIILSSHGIIPTDNEFDYPDDEEA